jgi:hypothetical protein
LPEGDLVEASAFVAVHGSAAYLKTRLALKHLASLVEHLLAHLRAFVVCDVSLNLVRRFNESAVLPVD